MNDADDDHLRASDAERQFVVDRLRDETSAARLTLDEFDTRAGAAYAARTRGDLLHLLRGLPHGHLPPVLAGQDVTVDPLAGPPDLGARARRRYRNRMRIALSWFVPANVAVLAIDLVADGNWGWSRWVLLVTAIGLVAKALQGTGSDREAELREWHTQRSERDGAERAAAERAERTEQPGAPASATSATA